MMLPVTRGGAYGVYPAAAGSSCLWQSLMVRVEMKVMIETEMKMEMAVPLPLLTLLVLALVLVPLTPAVEWLLVLQWVSASRPRR